MTLGDGPSAAGSLFITPSTAGAIAPAVTNVGGWHMGSIDFARWEAKGVFDAVMRDGYIEFDGCIPGAIIGEARDQAVAAVAQNGGQYLAIAGQKTLAGELLNGLYDDEKLHALCTGLYSRAVGRPSTQRGLNQLLRCLQGQTAKQESRYLHFDSFLITIVIPVAIPERGPSGDLILLRWRRRVDQSYLSNLFQKFIGERKLVQRVLWLGVDRGWVRSTRLKLKQGSAYLFFGSTTMHANEPCAADALRATLVLHFGASHQNSRLRKLLGR
jgi:hypothetical protein